MLKAVMHAGRVTRVIFGLVVFESRASQNWRASDFPTREEPVKAFAQESLVTGRR